MAPERFNFARDVFDSHARDPQRLAMLWTDEAGAERRVTYRELSSRSGALAAGLLAAGLRRGQTVLLILPRQVEWWETMLACLRAGLVVAPGTVQLTPRDIAGRLVPSEAAAVITDADNAPKVDEALAALQAQDPARGRPRCVLVAARSESAGAKSGAGVGTGASAGGSSSAGSRPSWLDYEALLAGAPTPAEWSGMSADTLADEPALLFFTSGTTGAPKMALHTQASYGRGHAVTARWLDLRPTDLHWNLSDTGWGKAAWSSLFAPWIVGCAIFVHHAPRFAPRRTLELLGQHPITTLCGAPTNYRLLIQQDFTGLRFPALRSCVAAGEPMNPEVIAVWQRHTGITLRDGYGQTETVLAVGNFPDVAVRPGSMGKPSAGWDVCVVDELLTPLPAGSEGEVAIRVRPARPVGLFAGYWKDAERTAAVFRGDWYCTGDRARVDGDGYFWFVGRADDVIKSSGYRIGPFEVESALLEHPAVVESAVVGVPDALRGQLVKAYVVLRAGHAAAPALVEELQAFVRERTAPYKYPREIEFVAELPKTVSGKIRRVELRGRAP